MTTNSLNTMQKKNIDSIINSPQCFTTVDSHLGEFISLYLKCEATARKLVQYHIGKSNGKLFISQIEASIKHFFPQKQNSINIKSVFLGDKGYRGRKSCRQLRNGYFHSLSEEDKKEIDYRFQKLQEYMQEWIDVFNI